MRHRVQSLQLNRDTNHRKHLLRNLVRELVEHGSIVTTKVKAKETKKWADKLIGKAQAGTIAARRNLHKFFGKRDVVNTLVDRVAPAMKDRKSGFTTVAPHGTRRGDSTPMVKLSLIVQPERAGTLKSDQPKKVVKAVKSTKAAKPAAKETKPVAKAPAKKAEKTAKSEAAPVAKKAPAKKTATKKTSKSEKK